MLGPKLSGCMAFPGSVCRVTSGSAHKSICDAVD